MEFRRRNAHPNGCLIPCERIRSWQSYPARPLSLTGASRGTGRSSALAFAREEAQVLSHYGRGKAEAEAVVAEIRSAGGSAEAVGADLAVPDGAHTLARQVGPLVGDRLDSLIANAGVSKAATIE